MFNILHRMIEQNNYNNIEDMRNKIDVFYAATPARISTDQYKNLNDMLDEKENTIIETEELI